MCSASSYYTPLCVVTLSVLYKARGRTELFLNFVGEVQVELLDASAHTSLLGASEPLRGDRTFAQVVWAGKAKRESNET